MKEFNQGGKSNVLERLKKMPRFCLQLLEFREDEDLIEEAKGKKAQELKDFIIDTLSEYGIKCLEDEDEAQIAFIITENDKNGRLIDRGVGFIVDEELNLSSVENFFAAFGALCEAHNEVLYNRLSSLELD